MGFTTVFWGAVGIAPALNRRERSYLRRFAAIRRQRTSAGPYHAEPGGLLAWRRRRPEILDHDTPPEGQPNLWCQWVPARGGAELRWDGREKFYDAADWMRYLVDHFLRPGALAAGAGDPRLAGFTFDHRCDGTVFALAAPESLAVDAWRIEVADGVVREVDYEVPALTLDVDALEERGEELDVQGCFVAAMADAPGAVESLVELLARLAELGQAGAAARLRAFAIDLAPLHPRPDAFAAALGGR